LKNYCLWCHYLELNESLLLLEYLSKSSPPYLIGVIFLLLWDDPLSNQQLIFSLQVKMRFFSHPHLCFWSLTLYFVFQQLLNECSLLLQCKKFSKLIEITTICV
jgi:hypothetical protein